MKSLTVAVLAVMIVLAQSFTFSLTTLSLTLMTLYKPANCFFGFFRRRGVSPSIIEEQANNPEGPIDMPASFQQTGYFNPMMGGGNRFLPSFPNIPGFGGGLPQFTRFQPLPSWYSQTPSPQNMPQMPSEEFPSNPNAFQPEPPRQEADTSFDEQPQINTEEAESFFTLLSETDENKCISRLVCELGADPSTAGELGSTISEIIGSLTDFPVGSKVAEYNNIIQRGRAQGLQSCASQFSTCDNESYMLMKTSQAEQDAETI